MIEVLKKLIHDEKGQGMVEFSSVLIALVTGAVLLVSAVKVNNR